MYIQVLGSAAAAVSPGTAIVRIATAFGERHCYRPRTHPVIIASHEDGERWILFNAPRYSLPNLGVRFLPCSQRCCAGVTTVD